MTDSIVSQQIDALVMGSSLRISSDRQTGDTTISALPTAASQVASSGDVVPTSVFDAEAATQQHMLLDGKLADIRAQLDEVVYDPKTGAASPKVQGRDRELLEIQEVQFNHELQFLAHHALDQLPKVGDSKVSQQDSLEAQARRQANITTLAESQGISRVEAMKLIDEATKRAAADRLVRG